MFQTITQESKCACGQWYSKSEWKHSWRDDNETHHCKCGRILGESGGGYTVLIRFIDGPTPPPRLKPLNPPQTNQVAATSLDPSIKRS